MTKEYIRIVEDYCIIVLLPIKHLQAVEKMLLIYSTWKITKKKYHYFMQLERNN